MKILITGSTGFIGEYIISFLSERSHEIVRLVRYPRMMKQKSILWSPTDRSMDISQLEGFDAVIHLAGENIAGRWTAKKKKRIRDSRVNGTQFLCDSLAKLDLPPKVLLSSSAIGFYGDRGDDILDENSEIGSGFLPEVCREWEMAVDPAIQKGIRVIHLRFGVILHPKGGALAQMLTPFKLGVGGVIGDGYQFMSWVSLADTLGAILHALNTESLNGPVNIVSPNPVTNRIFTKTLGKMIKRPTIFPMPSFAAHLLFGEMADALLLSSARVLPSRIQESGSTLR